MKQTIIRDNNGLLIAGEFGKGLPFVPLRYFVITDVPNRSVRGKHAHRTLQEVLICLSGSLTVMTDDGVSYDREETVLTSGQALYVPALVWREHYDYAPDTTLLVLASDVYRADDYIRDYREFLKEVRSR